MDIQVTNKKGRSLIAWSIRQNPLFSRLSTDQVDKICFFSKEIKLKKGKSLFHRGDEFHCFYFVCQGTVKLFAQSSEGHEKILQIIGEGHFFAETLLFDHRDRFPFSAEAMQKTTVIAINARSFMSIVKDSPEVHTLFTGHLSQRVHSLLDEIEILSLLSCRNRVASYFYDQATEKGQSFVLDIQKNAIASLLSLKPETFSRLLKELCKKDILQVRDNHITVQDMDLLHQQVIN